MPDAPTVPDLAEARSALAQLAAQDALRHLEEALRSLQGLSASLQNGGRLPASEQRTIERSLLRFRADLRDAGVLAAQGLAYCREWTEMLTPPPTYQSDGVVAQAADGCHQVSINA